MSPTAAVARPSPIRPSRRSALVPLVAAVLVVGGTIGALACGSTTTSGPATTVLLGEERPRATAGGSPFVGSTGTDGALTSADGLLPDDADAFDDQHPGVANLDAQLLRALREAATDAADDGIELQVNSGWRSAEHQERLLADAIVEQGSAEAAARWVATPETSAHVSGDAVDVGPAPAADWLDEHGAAHGLCRTYANEPWHFELRPDAVDEGCPRPFADPTEDPRMQR